MASTKLHGPYDLNVYRIDERAGDESGAYALGDLDQEGKLIVKYVGRSDTDLNSRLKEWIGKYQSFQYGHFSTKKEAFERECHMYHDFGGNKKLDNTAHPERPDGRNYSCPHPGCTELD